MEDAMQVDFTGYLEKNSVENYCHVVINGKSVDKEYAELFDSDKFDMMYSVTYVSSAQFFSKIAEKYKQVQIILGIDKEVVNEAFAQGTYELIMNKGVEFFKYMEPKAKNMVVENAIIVKYAELGSVIHSKLYLLESSKTGATRVIIGSANLTESAFNNKIHQYEEVMVFDDDAVFETYKERFNVLKNAAVDYIPKKVINKYKDEQIVFIDKEEKLNLIIDGLTEKNAKLVITDEIASAVRSAADEQAKKQTEYKIITQVISHSTKVKNKQLVIKSPSEISKLRPVFKNLLFKTTKTAEELKRFCLNYNAGEKTFVKIIHDEEIGKKAMNFAEECENEDINETLNLIEKFIEAYKNFTVENEDNTNLSKVYEVVLYSFLSAFIFMIREQYGISIGKVEKREDVPMFMIIGGRAYAGKSNLLSFVSKLISGEQSNHYLHYNDIQKPNVIEGLFYEENVFPIFVDEVEPKFFKSTANSKGEALIKNLANSLDTAHPTFICTTNTKTFDVPAQVLRRVYYIQIDKTFNELKKNEADIYYINIMSNINNKLFKDFCYKVCKRIQEGKPLYFDSVDWVWLARNLFVDYYNQVGRDIPEYFPRAPFNDYKERGRNMWKTLFREKREMFSFNEEMNELLVNFEGIDKSNRSSYFNYLLNGCIKEDIGIYLVLNDKIFFDWIDEYNPFVRKEQEKGFRKLIQAISKGFRQ